MRYPAVVAFLIPSALWGQDIERKFDDWEFSNVDGFCSSAVTSFGADSRLLWGGENGSYHFFIITRQDFSYRLAEQDQIRVTFKFDNEVAVDVGQFLLVGRKPIIEGGEPWTYFMATDPSAASSIDMKDLNTVDVSAGTNYFGSFPLTGSTKSQRAFIECTQN